MTRPARTWLLFTLCLSVALAGLGWITATTLQLDRAQRDAEQQAFVEENTRLALWRMDSAVLPILMDENARPYYQYSPTYHMQLNPNDPNGLTPELDHALNLSPLVAQEVPYRRVYFQVDPQGNVISPQLPGVVNRMVAPDSAYNDRPSQVKQVQYLNELQDTAQLQSVAQALAENHGGTESPPPPADGADTPATAQVVEPKKNADYRFGKGSEYQERMNSSDLAARQGLSKLTANREIEPANQSMTNTDDFPGGQQPGQQREGPGAAPQAGQQAQPQTSQQEGQQAGQQSRQPAAPQAGQQAGQQSEPPDDSTPAPLQNAAPEAVAPPVQPSAPSANSDPGPQVLQVTDASTPAVSDHSLRNIYTDNNWYQPVNREADPAKVGTMTPLWRNRRLLLTRKVSVAHQEFVQGVWLDWPALQTKLLADVQDLLPNARLEPLPAAAATAATAGETDGAAPTAAPHRLALLPVQLHSGDLPLIAAPGLSPVERTLAIAWLGILLAALAAAALLYGVVALSERRAAFVSAVTHELRTPLTTFRMYTEMLSAGMVRDPEKQAKYLGTMRAEAVRLGHLVENVLAYARLERGGHHNPRAGRRETITVADLLERLTPHLTERAEQARMQLALPTLDAATAAASLTTDPAAVEQILFNLVDNGCKYGRTPVPDPTAAAPSAAGDRGPVGRLELSLALTARDLHFTLRDFGAGIPADQQPRLFQPFSRSAEVAANTPTRTPGVGLGLALCRRLARALGGDIQWNRAVHPGTAFDLRLPRGL